MSERRTVTLPTSDHGDLTIPEPSWCVGHSHHDPETERANILHTGPDIALVFRGHTIGDASLVQSPYADLPRGGLGVSVSLLGQTLDPVGVYELAANLDTFADQLRDLADQLTTLLTEGAP